MPREIEELVRLSQAPLNSADHQSDRPQGEMRLTDVGNAERFAAQHRGNALFCYGLREWFVWDGTRYASATGGQIMQLAKQTARQIYVEASHEPDEVRRKSLGKWATESESESRLRAMVSLARSESDMSIDAEALDRAPLLLNCLNGTLDLRTGDLRPARREDFITKLVPVAYDPAASCPEFEAMLQGLFGSTPAVLGYLQRILGYALSGLTSEQCFFVLYGTGANGKSTLLRTILDLLGDYAAATRPETFLLKRSEGIPNDLAALAGARFVTALESDEGKRLAEGLIKGVTGGDKVTARFMRKEFFTFVPQLKLFIGTNHRPAIRGTDHGIWRRVRLVPFQTVIPEDRQDKNLPDKLRAEQAGILRWLVEGCLLWQRDGLGPPLEVQQATAAYRQEEDVVGQFVKERCIMDEQASVKKGDLFDEYVAWAKTSGESRVLSKRQLGAALRERGIQDGWCERQKGWTGLRVKTIFEGETSEDAIKEQQATCAVDPSSQDDEAEESQPMFVEVNDVAQS